MSDWPTPDEALKALQEQERGDRSIKSWRHCHEQHRADERRRTEAKLKSDTEDAARRWHRR